MRRALDSELLHAETPGKPPGRILCATDLTARSENALLAARNLAARTGAELTLGHVVMGRGAAQSVPVAEERLRQQSAPMKLDRATVVVERNGSHARVIAQLATQSDAELIVLGAQSTRPLVTFVGTTAERVAARTDLPVLVINSGCGLHYSNVIFTADYPQFVANLIGMADRWGLLDAPCLSIVHGLTYRGPMLDGRADAVATSHYFNAAEEAVRALLMNELSDAGIDPSRFNVTIADEYPLDVVRRALPSSGSSLLVLGTSSHEAFRRVFNGSLANDVLLSLDCDVVLVRPPSRAHSSRPHSRTADHFARRAS